MKRFVRKILTFAAISICICILIVFLDFRIVKNQYTGTYQASLVDKVARATSIQGPKILLIGNSSLCFGMDSQMMEEALGMPVVDMGLHGGLNNAFHEEMAKQTASEGDIVVLCHSNYSDDDTISNADLAWITIEKHFELWPLIRKKDWPSMVKAYPKYAINSLVHWISGTGNRISDDTCYSRSAFNEFGDIAFRPPEHFEFRNGNVQVPEINEICISRINALNDEMRARDATLLVAGYPIAKGEFTPPASEYEEFEAELRKELKCPVISHFKDYFIPYTYFYNTAQHLNEKGAHLRTMQLIQDICAWMANGG